MEKLIGILYKKFRTIDPNRRVDTFHIKYVWKNETAHLKLLLNEYHYKLYTSGLNNVRKLLVKV